jgi:hypothetical protein
MGAQNIYDTKGGMRHPKLSFYKLLRQTLINYVLNKNASKIKKGCCNKNSLLRFCYRNISLTALKLLIFMTPSHDIANTNFVKVSWAKKKWNFFFENNHIWLFWEVPLKV